MPFCSAFELKMLFTFLAVSMVLFRSALGAEFPQSRTNVEVDDGSPSAVIVLDPQWQAVQEGQQQDSDSVDEILLLYAVQPGAHGKFCTMFEEIGIMLEDTLRASGVATPIRRACCAMFDWSCWRRKAPGEQNILVRKAIKQGAGRCL